MCCRTLPPPPNPKGQPVRSEKRRAGGLSGVSRGDVRCVKGAVFRRFGPWLGFGGKVGEPSKVRFSPQNKGFKGL